MKGKLQLVVALLLVLILSGGAFAVAYLTAGGTIGITEPTEDIATYNATATQPDWASILTADERTEILRPDAAGDETNIDNQLPGTGAHWDKVAEETADGDSTVVYTSSTGWQEDLYSTANHTEGSSNINYVKVYIVCRSTATPIQNNAYVHIKTNGGESNGTQVTTTTSYSTFSRQWDDNPQTGNPWTWDEIDALQIGVGLREATTGEFTGCTQVYVEIGYGAPLVIGEVPTGDLFDVTPNPRYSGDLHVGVYLANTGNLTKAYQYLNMKLYLEGSAEAEETPNYRLLTLQNGQTELTLEELVAITGDWTQTSQTDFEGGTLNQVEVISPGDVLLDTFADNVTDSYDDETKIATSANVTVSGGQVKLTAGGVSGSETFRPNAAGDETNISDEYPAWFNSSWSRRVPVTINNSGSALTDYQIEVDVTYDGDMQADFDDIRFTDTDGSTLLSYWRESYISSTSAIFWVEVPSIPAGTKNIFMYYGNATVSTTSDGDATFEFFDDFEDGDISDWSTYSSGVVQIANDGGNYVLLKTSNNDPNGGYSLFNNGSVSDFEAIFLTKRINEDGGTQNRYGIENGSFNGYGPRMYDFNSLPSNFAIERRTGGTGSNLASKSTSAYEWDTWMTVVFRKYGSNLEFELYNSSGSLAESISTTDSTYNSFDRFVVHGGYEFYTDDIRVRKYTSTDPTASFGTEESEGGHWDKVDDVTADDFSTYVYTSSSPPGNWYNTSWQYRRQITINSANVTGNLTNFPVLINTTDTDWRDTTNGGHVGQSDGGDILFTSSDGTSKLDHEIERYTPSTGELVAWVEVPSLSATSDTDIYIYYGNAGAADQWNVAGTWDSSYIMVQHLVDDPDTSHTQDSTANNHDGTKKSANNPIEASGQIGRAQDFSSDHISCGDLGIGDNYTAECWIKADTLTGSGDQNTYGFTIMASAVSGQGYPLWLAARGTEVRLWAYESTPSTGGWRETTGAGLNTTDRFHIVATAIKSSTTKVYVNGVERLSFTNDGDVNWTNIFTIGDLRPDRAIYFDGVTDEVRISNTIRSAEWVETSYNNQENPGVFYTVGSVETNGYQLDLYNIPDHVTGSGEINGVTVYFRFSGDSNGSDYTAYAKAAIKTNGTVYEGDEQSQTGKTFVSRSYQWTTNPDTGSDWTWDEIDALQIGVSLKGQTGSSFAYCTQVYAVVACAYDTLGTLTSINLLSGETVSRIDSFYYDASAIPSGTGLRVQFSQDNTNWYNSAGTLGGWDTLSEGTDSIDLSGLNWTSANFYYHMEFTSDDIDTPVLDEISVIFATYYASGDLVSSAYDTGDDLNWDWGTVSFTIAEPSTTNIQFQLRSAATEGGLSSATWYGPTGTGDYYTTSGTAINSVHDGDRWIQYKAYFSGPGDSTPTLSDITITYTAAATSYTVSVIGGSYALISEDTSDWSEGWTLTPEFYLEITQR